MFKQHHRASMGPVKRRNKDRVKAREIRRAQQSSQTHRVARNWLFALIGSFAATPAFVSTAIPTAHADDQVGAGLRWFEVEVLIFKQRPQYYTDQEQFPLTINPIPLTRHIDLLSQHRGNGSQHRGIPGLMVPCPATYTTAAQNNIARFVNEDEWGYASAPDPSQTSSSDRDQWLPVLNNYQVESQTLTTMVSSDVLCQNDDDFVFVDAWYENPNRPIATGPRDIAPAVIDGPHGDMYRTRSPFLLPASSLQLTDLRSRLASQAGKQTLLHTAWRQPVFSRNQGQKIRLFGGENFSRDFEYLGFARDHYLTPLTADTSMANIGHTANSDNARTRRTAGKTADRTQTVGQTVSRAEITGRIDNTDNTDTHDPLMRIDRLLNAIDTGETPFTRPDSQALGLPERPSSYPPNLPTEAWELDGLMHVYLVGNYLHVHGAFNLREEVEVPLQATSLQAQAEASLRDKEATEAFLRAYYFDQIRRMISHEVHYLDHPHIGVVVQIRRTELSARR